MDFEELDFQETDLGTLILRRRRAMEADGREIFEVKLNDEYLMSSLFHEGEEALADLGLKELTGDKLDIVVGGLGLGYTAAAALADNRVARLTVVEALAPVIDWHQRGIVCNGAALSADKRCEFCCADFFEMARTDGFDVHAPGHAFNAILLDIDHTPEALLNPAHSDFYTAEGLRRLRSFLKPGGVFALWSNEIPDPAFLAILEGVFDEATGHTVEFTNPIQRRTEADGVYVARKDIVCP